MASQLGDFHCMMTDENTAISLDDLQMPAYVTFFFRLQRRLMSESAEIYNTRQSPAWVEKGVRGRVSHVNI